MNLSFINKTSEKERFDTELSATGYIKPIEKHRSRNKYLNEFIVGIVTVRSIDP